MGVKYAINRTLGKLGYTITRSAETIARDEKLLPSPQDEQVSPSPQKVIASSGLTLRAAANEPPRNCTFLAEPGGYAGATYAQQIAEFQAHGITIIPTDAAAAAEWRQSEVFDRTVSNLHSAWDWAGNAVSARSHYLQTGIPSPGLVKKLETLFGSDAFDTFFRGILGCSVQVANCRLVRSLPHPEKGEGPQSWHQDGCPPGVVRGVLYLTDVDDLTGPFQYKDAAGDIHTVLGQTGDLLVFDAMRLVHRASPPKESARTAIDLVFMPRLPGDDFRFVVSGMNHWPADPFQFSRPDDRTDIRQGLSSHEA